MVGEGEPPWHACGGEDGESELVNGVVGGFDRGRFSHHNRLAWVEPYQRHRPPRKQKRQAAHLGPNAQSPSCHQLLDFHRLRNVRPRRLDPPSSRFGPNWLRRNRKWEWAWEQWRFSGGNGDRNCKDTKFSRNCVWFVRKHWEDLSFVVLNFLRKQIKIIYIIGL